MVILIDVQIVRGLRTAHTKSGYKNILIFRVRKGGLCSCMRGFNRRA